MTLLGATSLTKAFGTRVLLDGASLSIDEGERIGVVGRNGAGKSTLAKILAGLELPDSGTLAVRRGARVAYLEQEPEIGAGLSVRDAIASGMAVWSEAKERHRRASERVAAGEGDLEAALAAQADAAADVERAGGWERDHEVERVASHLGLTDLTMEAARLSGGQKRRVALGRILLEAPDLMILDEPTNHLDADTIAWLETYLLESFRGAVVLVTHDRWLLDRVADRTLEVDGGKVYSYQGGYEAFLEAKAERLSIEERTEKNRQNFLRTELEWLRRQPKARSTKQKARIDRARTAIASGPSAQVGSVELSAEVAQGGRTILTLRDLTLSLGGRTLVRGLTLDMRAGDRLGIVGPNGSGKTSLLRAVLGELTPDSGELVLGRGAKVAYLDQARQLLDGEATVYDVVANAVPIDGQSRVEPRSYLERFLFRVEDQKKQVKALSGGERARLALARLLASEANLLLLDEPSNDLDTTTLSALEDFLSTYGGSVLLVTHDRYLLDRVTTGILAFEGDGRVVRYAGAYQAYRAQRDRAEEERKLSQRPAPPPPDAGSARKERRGLSKNEQRELDGLPDRIDEAERAVARAEEALADPSLYTAAADPRLDARREELARAKAEAGALMDRWAALEEKSGA